MNENKGQSGGGRIVEIIVGIVVIIALVFLFKYIGKGIAWAFNEYVNLLRVN